MAAITSDDMYVTAALQRQLRAGEALCPLLQNLDATERTTQEREQAEEAAKSQQMKHTALKIALGVGIVFGCVGLIAGYIVYSRNCHFNALHGVKVVDPFFPYALIGVGVGVGMGLLCFLFGVVRGTADVQKNYAERLQAKVTLLNTEIKSLAPSPPNARTIEQLKMARNILEVRLKA